MKWVLASIIALTWLWASRQPLDAGTQAPTSTDGTLPRLAYTMLLSGWEGSSEGLLHTLELVKRHLLPWTPGRVLLFHTGEYQSAEQQQAVLQVLPSAEFTRVPEEAWTLPPGLKEEDSKSWAYAPCCPEHGIGYRHMCRWFSNGLFKYLAGRDFNWVLRLDEDSKVLSPAKTNLVAWMQSHGKRYGYRLWDEDDTEIIWSLPEYTSWYLTSKYMNPGFLKESCRPQSLAGLNSYGGWDRKVLYNNFFLVDIRWWLSEQVQDYLTSLEATNGHYLFRWGDAAVHTMVVKSFLKRSEAHMFGFAYRHKDNSDAARVRFIPAGFQELPP